MSKIDPISNNIIHNDDWPFRLPRKMAENKLRILQNKIKIVEEESQYGWGHTIDFGGFIKEGLLGYNYLKIVGLWDKYHWLPKSLKGFSIADVGCFTGGISAILAAREANVVYAVDEIEAHLKQCEIVSEAFGLATIKAINASIYNLPGTIPEKLDLIVLSGVLYHLSDMLVGLNILRDILKPGGVLLIESNAIDDGGRSYANFGNFYAGMWWQPSRGCINDMCRFAGFNEIEIEFYEQERCVARAIRGEEEIPFKRGMNKSFNNLRDSYPRSLDSNLMNPANIPKD